MKPKVALINVVLDGDYQYRQEIPLGLASIASFLRSHDYDVVLHQCFPSDGEEEIEKASEIDADVFGFQISGINFASISQIAGRIKERSTKASIVLGGPFLIAHSEEILRNESNIDFIVLGEGELTILQLLEQIESGDASFSNILGLSWINPQGEIVRNPPRAVVPDLDSFPFPARDFFEDARRDPVDKALMESVRVITSRGCVGRCSFCLVNLQNDIQKGKKWRGRSPKNVVDELEYLIKKHDAWLFNFSDSSFDDPGPEGKKRSKEICKEIIARKLELSAKIYIRCDTMKAEEDMDLLHLYKRAGIDVIIAGAEAGSDYELQLYEKRATAEDNLRTMRMLQDTGLFYALFGFIMFGPNSTLETISDNIELLKKVNCCDNILLICNVLILFRNCTLYHRLKEEGRVIEPEHYWEPPKYLFIDTTAERIARHWENTLSLFEVASQLNSLQINICNLVARLSNPMNKKITELLEDDCAQLKQRYSCLSKELSDQQYEHFTKIVDMVGNQCSDKQLNRERERFHSRTYQPFITEFEGLYSGFLNRVSAEGFGMRGLVFRHFTSAMLVKGVDRTVSQELKLVPS